MFLSNCAAQESRTRVCSVPHVAVLLQIAVLWNSQIPVFIATVSQTCWSSNVVTLEDVDVVIFADVLQLAATLIN